MLRVALRNIYKMAMDSTLARTAFLLWCEKATAIKWVGSPNKPTAIVMMNISI